MDNHILTHIQEPPRQLSLDPEANSPKDEEEFQPFFEFPSEDLLREANEQYTALGRPLPRDDKGGLMPYPPARRKQDVYNLKQFAEIDKYAMEAPGSMLDEPLQRLVNHLTRPTKNDIGKVRVIFRWITGQKLSTFPESSVSNEVKEETVRSWLDRVKQENVSYTDMFVKMCSLAGIQSRVVWGHGKGVNYEPGDVLGEDTWGSWAAVVIDHNWHFVDPQWGAAYEVLGYGRWKLIDDNGQGAKQLQRDRPKGVIYECNEAYFLPDPEEMIYYHYPADIDAWQLLARKVTLREFTEMAYVKPGFFELGLRLLNNRKCVLQASQGEIEIELGIKPGGKRKFMYRLWKSKKVGEEPSSSFEEEKLDRFVLMQHRKGMLSFRLFFPEKGKYKLEVFGMCTDKPVTPGAGGRYGFACAYIIEVDKAMEGCRALPENNRREWGPGEDLEGAGLTALTHNDGIIEAEDGTVEVRFRADRAIELLHNLHSNHLTKDQLKNFVVHRREGNDIVMNIKLPEKDDYALNLYAKDQGRDGALPNVCSYLVSTANPAFDPIPFPSVPNGCTGPTAEYAATGLRQESHASAMIGPIDSGEVVIVFETTKPVDVTTALEHQSVEGPAVVADCVFQSMYENSISFDIQFPEAGTYAFKMYAKEKGRPGMVPNVFNYVINVTRPKEQWLPFPKCYQDWSDGCFLKEQVYGMLPCDKVLPFTLKIPKAHKVAAIGKKGWTFMSRDEDDYWHAEVETGEPGQQLKICAGLDEGTNQFSILLVYEVKSEDDIQDLLDKQQQIMSKASGERQREETIKKKRKSEFKEAKNALLKAMAERDLAALRKAVKHVENGKYVHRLDYEVKSARTLIKSLERIALQRETILYMDPEIMAAIMEGTNPPFLVREVMVAVLLLLGDHEGLTRNWRICQKLCTSTGPNALRQRVKEFDVQRLHPEIAERALHILPRFRLDDVRDHSDGAALFFEWALAMIQELRMMDPAAASAKPADLYRQQQIFAHLGQPLCDSQRTTMKPTA